MSEELDSKDLYQQNRKTIVEEIKGEIVLVNEAIGSVYTLMNQQPKATYIMDAIAAFKGQFLTLFFNSLEIIKDPELQKSCNKYLTESLNRNKFEECINKFVYGTKLWLDVQKYLFEIGIKDINADPFCRYPWQYYKDIIDNKQSDERIGGANFSVSILGYKNGESDTDLVRQVFSKIMFLLGINMECKPVFYNSLPWFVAYFDKRFILNCIDIETKIDKLDIPKSHKDENIFRLQLGEFSRLLVRRGYTTKPDVSIMLEELWEVPKTVSEIRFNGEK